MSTTSSSRRGSRRSPGHRQRRSDPASPRGPWGHPALAAPSILAHGTSAQPMAMPHIGTLTPAARARPDMPAFVAICQTVEGAGESRPEAFTPPGSSGPITVRSDRDPQAPHRRRPAEGAATALASRRQFSRAAGQERFPIRSAFQREAVVKSRMPRIAAASPSPRRSISRAAKASSCLNPAVSARLSLARRLVEACSRYVEVTSGTFVRVLGHARERHQRSADMHGDRFAIAQLVRDLDARLLDRTW